MRFLTWGLIPSWIKDMGKADDIRTKTYNARSETIFEKPSFRESAKEKRCLVLVDGCYEWRYVGGKNFPHYIRMVDKEPFAIAGLWNGWNNPETGKGLDTFSVITTKANPLLEKIHNKKKRMPAILRPQDERKWLDPNLEKEDALALLEPIEDTHMEAYPVSRLISFKNSNTNVPEVREKVEYEELKSEQKTLFS